MRKYNMPGLLFIVTLVLLWELLVGSGTVKFEFLPPPTSVFSAFFSLTTSGKLPLDLFHTLIACMVGWVAGSAMGILSGTILGLSKTTWINSMASVEVLRALPAIAFVPVAVLLLGFSLNMEFLVTTYVAVWPVLVNTIDGTRSVSDSHKDVARMLKMGSFERIIKIVLPSAAPTVYVGLRLSLSLALALAVVSEMVGDPAGVGYSLVTMQQALQPAAMLAYIVAIGLLGFLLNSGFLFLTRRLTPGISAFAERREA